jgi:GntR family transcriptional regulator / MocR family aminotransferase
LPAHIHDRLVVERAALERIAPRALSGFALAPCDEDNGLVIGYGNTPAEEIAHAVSLLARIANEVERSEQVTRM